MHAIALLALLAPLQSPLPVDRDATLKTQDAVYTIEGRVLLESRIDLESQRAIRLRGLGEGATLVVAGSFTAKAALGGANLFENVTIEVAPECRELYLANVTWSSGGGIRTAEAVEFWFDLGVARVVIGTAALKDPQFVRDMARAWEGGIVVAVDARDGKVATEGWAELSDVPAIDMARRQGSKSLELRATTSLCWLWQCRGMSGEGRVLLADIYGRFAEGFATADVQEARALLAAL